MSAIKKEKEDVLREMWKEIPDSTKFCPYCGAPVSKAQDFVNKAGEAFNAAEQELGSAFDEVKQSFTGNSANQQNAGGQYNGGYQNNGAGQYNARLPE